MTTFRDIMTIIAAGDTLNADEMGAAMDLILEGKTSEIALAGFLMGLRARGETPTEIAAAARAMRARAIPVEAPEDAIDTCGTGGDGADTYNISTAAALITAGCGVPVAKHGNKAASSKSGSSDVLKALGVNLAAETPTIGKAIREANIGFLFAAYHHKAVGAAASVRQSLGVRTIFNLLGPLSNPAGARRQVIGVFDPAFMRPLAEALRDLGAKRVWIVHGADGLDELTTTDVTHVVALDEGSITDFTVAPEDAGLSRSSLADLKGGDPDENAAALRALLDGAPGAYRDIAILNAAAALIVADKARDLADGAAQAAHAIDTGAAQAALSKLVAITNE